MISFDITLKLIGMLYINFNNYVVDLMDVLSIEDQMIQIRRQSWHVTCLSCCIVLLVLVSINVNAVRRPRRKRTTYRPFTKKVYDNLVQELEDEKRHEDYASVWLMFIKELELNITSQIYHPVKNGGEKLCNDIGILNHELDTVLVPLKQQKPHIAYVARKIINHQGPHFLQQLLPENSKLKETFRWNDYQLSRFYRLWMDTRMIWEEFKEAFLLMQAKCYHLRTL